MSAATACGESRLVRLAPAPQNQGRNWKLPSSVLMPENVMPFLPMALTLASAAVRVAQLVMELRADARRLQDRRVVVQRQRVRADRHAVGLAVDDARAEDVLRDRAGGQAVLRGGGEDARAGERGDHGVVDQQDVRRVALLAGQQGLGRQRGGVIGGALDRHARPRSRTWRPAAPRPTTRCTGDTGPRRCRFRRADEAPLAAAGAVLPRSLSSRRALPRRCRGPGAQHRWPTLCEICARSFLSE